MIVDAQLAELRATAEIHQRFTDLSVEGAAPAEVVAQTAALAGAPVVLENLSRQVLAYDAAGGSAELLLANWESHSRAVQPPGRTGHDAEAGWLVTVVGARGQDWGRLLIRLPAAAPEARHDHPHRAGRVDPGAGTADPARRRRTADAVRAARGAAPAHRTRRRRGRAGQGAGGTHWNAAT